MDRETIKKQKNTQKPLGRTDRQYNGKKITRSHRGQTENTLAKR
jgi:hypothetical protein